MIHPLFLTFLGVTCAQVIPNTYVHPEFRQSRATIESNIQKVYTAFTASYNRGGWSAQNAWTSVAQWDAQRGKRDFYNQVKKAQDYLATNPGGGYEVWKVALVNYYNDDIGWAGLSNIQAYEAYGDQDFLTRARGAYDFIQGHGLLTQDVLSKGWLEGTKNADNKIVSTCNGKSMLGGVYWVNGGNPTSEGLNPAAHSSVNAVSTGNFALLGAELCRVTKDMSYCHRSYESAQWLDRHMKADDGYLVDNINGKDCHVTDWKFTYNQALYIALYAQLGHLTNNQTATNLAKRAIEKSLASGAPWNNAQGVIKEGKGDETKSDDGIGFKSILIRYLQKSVPWLQDDELTDAIKEYANIQYYALSQLDSDNKNHPLKFGRNWEGPYKVSTDHAQLAALDVLNALALNPDSAFSQEGTGPVVALVDRAAPPAANPSTVNAVPVASPTSSAGAVVTRKPLPEQNLASGGCGRKHTRKRRS